MSTLVERSTMLDHVDQILDHELQSCGFKAHTAREQLFQNLGNFVCVTLPVSLKSHKALGPFYLVAMPGEVNSFPLTL